MTKDVVFFTNHSYASNSNERRRAYPPITGRMQLYNDIYAESSSREDWDKTRTACTLIGHQDAIPQFTRLYAFIREFDEDINEANRTIWDHDERLQICIGLSRLIHPTTISFEFSARFLIEDGNEQVIPGPTKGFGGKAWISRPDARNWLSIDEANELATLVTSFYNNISSLPTKVRQALWYLEYAFRTEFLDVRWPLICFGLESLIHTEFRRSTVQFSQRVSLLASEVGIIDFPVERARDAYNTRSALVHGNLFRDLSPYRLDIYEKTEETLRRVIKKAIMESTYAQHFFSLESVHSAYPLR